jgi:hypothetical protein
MKFIEAREDLFNPYAGGLKKLIFQRSGLDNVHEGL